MSKWTHILAVITAVYTDHDNTIKSRGRLINVLNNNFKKLPIISGSEQNATVSLNINDYFNPDGYDYSFSISIYGSLRDRSIKETLKEYNNFLQKVDSFFTVTDHMYKIDNDRFKTLIYTSSKKKKKIIIDSENKMFKRLDEVKI